MPIIKYTLVWSDFDITSVSCIEDPLYQTYIDTDTFIEIYGPVLQTLDGRDISSHIDFYFSRSVLNDSMLCFIDDDTKADFLDLAIEMDLVPAVKDICEGMSRSDKAAQKADLHQSHKKFMQEVKQGEQQGVRKNINKQDANKKRTDDAKKTLDKLMSKLNNEADAYQRKLIDEKIQRTLSHINVLHKSI